MPQLRLADGVSADAVRWPNLGYADAYTESYELFRGLQAEGTIPEGVRFQMQYPTPLAGVAGTIAPDELPAVAASYGAVLFADLDRALETIPHDRCAVQWDVALAMQVALVNALTAGARRPLDFVSFTVPQARDDADYFAPLRDLQTGPATELDFALVPYHPDDQASGTTSRQVGHIDAALAQSAGGAREWGICTECGMGRVDARDVPRLLDLHREILKGPADGW